MAHTQLAGIELLASRSVRSEYRRTKYLHNTWRPRILCDNGLCANVLCIGVLSLLLLGLGCATTRAADHAWWQFRGPDGDGHSEGNPPIEWNETKNVAWKTAIHDRGWSSPVVWGDQIWLTTATLDGHRLWAICIDKNSGKVLHDVPLFDVENPMKITRDNTYATPTPAIEDGRVFVHFGTYGTACLNTRDGRVLWRRRDLNCDHEVGAGPASSPTLIDGHVVVHVDGRDVQYVVGLDRATGKTVWKTTRSIDFRDIPVHHRKAFCMPTTISLEDGDQFVSPGGRAIYGYDLSGKEIWRIRHRGFSVAPRPVFGHGMIFATIDRDHPELWAIRPDGRGDVTDSHVVWKETKGMPQRCSPILVGDLLFVVNRDGIATCLDARTGAQVWRARLRGQYSASPIYAKGRLYFLNEDATTTIVRPGRELAIVQTNSLASQPLLASPAVDGDALIVRTEKYLYRIEEGAANSQPRNRASVEPDSVTPDSVDPDSVDPDSVFVGRWEIGKSTPRAQPKFIMSLFSDGSAKKSHVPQATGEWKVVDGEARVVWSDGWRDIIRREGSRFRKVAFGPGRNFQSPVSNTDTAEKLPE